MNMRIRVPVKRIIEIEVRKAALDITPEAMQFIEDQSTLYLNALNTIAGQIAEYRGRRGTVLTSDVKIAKAILKGTTVEEAAARIARGPATDADREIARRICHQISFHS